MNERLLSNGQLLSLMIKVAVVCAIVVAAIVVLIRKRGKILPAQSEISATIKCKNVASLYIVGALAFIASISVIVVMLASGELSLALMSVLFVIEIALLGAVAIGIGTLRKIVLYENELEICMPYSQMKPRYGYADVTSADQNRNGDVTLKTKDGREYTLKRMTDAGELLDRIEKAKNR